MGPTICYNTQPMPQHDVPSRGRVQADDGSGTFCEYAPKLTQRQKASEASSEAEVLWPSAQAAAQRTFGSCNVYELIPQGPGSSRHIKALGLWVWLFLLGVGANFEAFKDL